MSSVWVEIFLAVFLKQFGSTLKRKTQEMHPCLTHFTYTKELSLFVIEHCSVSVLIWGQTQNVNHVGNVLSTAWSVFFATVTRYISFKF